MSTPASCPCHLRLLAAFDLAHADCALPSVELGRGLCASVFPITTLAHTHACGLPSVKSQQVTGGGACQPPRHDHGDPGPSAKLFPRGPDEPSAQQHEQMQYRVTHPQQPQYAGSFPP